MHLSNGQWLSQRGECCGIDAQVVGEHLIITNHVCGIGAIYENEKVPVILIENALEDLEVKVELDEQGRVLNDVEVIISFGKHRLSFCLDQYDKLQDFTIR